MTDSAETTTQALCRVIYVRVTPDELAMLKREAKHAQLSVQRHARTLLGFTDRGGYRNRVTRKEQTDGQANQAKATGPQASIEKGDSESAVPPSTPQRVPMPDLPQQCSDQVLPQT